MNDVEATVKVFQQMKAEADALGIKYYNVLINDEERPLTYIPKLAKVIDKTKGRSYLASSSRPDGRGFCIVSRRLAFEGGSV
ncbi:hypothetical protein [Paenibacillus larvae]|uniref:hypothetical protein n=1 Tax=Paenibacillus larvae TaxID=1464 RepID=UPI0028922449|nr:hypothetical protein [Paenibacillus larvae]MDT2278137.1 hypothetical protein [Paenibacillus larvae]